MDQLNKIVYGPKMFLLISGVSITEFIVSTLSKASGVSMMLISLIFFYKGSIKGRGMREFLLSCLSRNPAALARMSWVTASFMYPFISGNEAVKVICASFVVIGILIHFFCFYGKDVGIK